MYLSGRQLGNLPQNESFDNNHSRITGKYMYLSGKQLGSLPQNESLDLNLTMITTIPGLQASTLYMYNYAVVTYNHSPCIDGASR